MEQRQKKIKMKSHQEGKATTVLRNLSNKEKIPRKHSFPFATCTAPQLTPLLAWEDVGTERGVKGTSAPFTVEGLFDRGKRAQKNAIGTSAHPLSLHWLFQCRC